MQAVKRSFSIAFAASLAIAAFSSQDAAATSLFQPTFEISFSNFGDISGPIELPFDGESHDVPGTSLRAGMSALSNEVYDPTDPGFVFGGANGWIESWVETDGTIESEIMDTDEFFSITAEVQDFYFVARTWGGGESYLYFTLDGEVVDLSYALSMSLFSIGPHPFDSSITYSVLHLPDAGWSPPWAPPPNTIDTAVFNMPWSVLMFGLQIHDIEFNGIHFGLSAGHYCDGPESEDPPCFLPIETPLVPEPGNGVLVGISLAVLGLAGRWTRDRKGHA
ncbi:MAG: hypothetical protein GY725_17615 [bacterium]|nr:hypothetical protein [bacterium]